MKPNELEPGSIIQIIPLGEDDPFAGCLMIVDEVKSWGVQCYMAMPTGGIAYFRVETGNFQITGAKAEFLAANLEVPTHDRDD